MATNGKREFGYPMVLSAKKGFQLSGTLNNQTVTIPLKDIPTTHNGLRFVVQRLMVRLPTATFPITPNRELDGVSMAQLIQTITLRLASNAPPAAYDSANNVLIDGVDGWSAFDALGHISGEPTFFGAYGPLSDVAVPPLSPASALTGQTARSLHYRQNRDTGWLHNQGPFGLDITGAASDFAQQVYLNLPIGVNKLEEEPNAGIPANWLNGDAGCKGSCSGSCGELVLVFGTKVDAQDIVWTAADGLDVVVQGMLMPETDLPIPNTPCIRLITSGENNIVTHMGIRQLLEFRKALTAGGAMQTLSYTRVQYLVAGWDVIDPDEAVKFPGLAAMNGASPWGQTIAQTTLLGRGAARFSRAGYPMVAVDKSYIRTQTDVSRDSVVKIVTTGETTHRLLDVTLTPMRDNFALAATEYSGVPTAKAVAASRNGNPVTGPAREFMPAKQHPTMEAVDATNGKVK